MTTTPAPVTDSAALAPEVPRVSACEPPGIASIDGPRRSAGGHGVPAAQWPAHQRRGRLRDAVVRLRTGRERGSATAEYAVVILAAVAFAGVLVAVMRSGAVASILEGLVTGALTS